VINFAALLWGDRLTFIPPHLEVEVLICDQNNKGVSLTALAWAYIHHFFGIKIIDWHDFS
jgi:hypothetical protein